MNVMYVKFSNFPEIKIRTVEEDDYRKFCVSKDGECRTVEEDKKLYPFRLEEGTVVTIFLKCGGKFSFRIEGHYVWNGADIPLGKITGSSYKVEYLIPSMLHDYLLEHKKDLMIDTSKDTYRKMTSDVFECSLLQNGVSKFKASVMSFAVDLFQKYFNGRKWQ